MRSALRPALMILLALVLGSAYAAARDKEKPVRPPTKQTQVIRADIYKKMEESQKAFEAKDHAKAIAALDTLKARQDKLNDYERATLYNLYAAVYYAQENLPKAIEAYRSVLAQPNLPEALRDGSLYALAQLYFISEQYAKAAEVLKQWLAMVAESKPEGYALLAQVHYQQQQYGQAEKALLQSLRLSQQQGQAPKESALALLRAIYYERKDYVKSARVLELLVASYPAKASYWQQLAGMKGLLDQQRERLQLTHAAYRGQLVTSEGDLLNLARLYMMQDAPYPAVRVITEGLRARKVRMNVENLQLYAQALAMAKEYRQQIPVLKKLAEMSGEARHYDYLGQAYTETGDWEQAVTAFRSALKAGAGSRAAEIQMQLGTALFNGGRFGEARQSFVAAQQSEVLANSAATWVRFVDAEIARRQAIAAQPSPP